MILNSILLTFDINIVSEEEIKTCFQNIQLSGEVLSMNISLLIFLLF